MGNKSATPPPPPPPKDFQRIARLSSVLPPLCMSNLAVSELKTPWRMIHWGRPEKERLMKEIRNLKPPGEEWSEFRILMLGQISAGKSSFLNTVGSIFQDRLSSRAVVREGSNSVTKKFTAYNLRDKKTGSYLPFTLCDVMGMEEVDEQGIHPEDIISAAKGLMKDGYEFNPVSPLKPDPSNRPPVTDQAHCIIYIVAADQLSLLKPNIMDKVKRVRNKLSDLGLPQVVLLTKVDTACPLVKEDLCKVYTSIYMKQQIEKCSQTVGIPVSHILPVKNYHEETSLNDDLDVLILSALLQTLHFANDHFENVLQAK